MPRVKTNLRLLQVERMNEKTISTAKLVIDHLPEVDASVEELIQFAHTFNGYARWGSFERCAEVANAREHSTIDTLRTCLFFEARRWRHSGETPDADAIRYWRACQKFCV